MVSSLDMVLFESSEPEAGAGSGSTAEQQRQGQASQCCAWLQSSSWQSVLQLVAVQVAVVCTVVLVVMLLLLVVVVVASRRRRSGGLISRRRLAELPCRVQNITNTM